MTAPMFRDQIAARNKKIKAILRQGSAQKVRVEGGRPDRGDLGDHLSH